MTDYTPESPASAGRADPSLRLHYAAVSDVGRVRKDNQDSGYAGAHLLAIADGVGGAARGDVASATAVGVIRTLDTPPTGDALAGLAGAIDDAHHRIAELVDQYPEIEGTGTTLTAGVLDGDRLGIGHVGDSRAYLIHDGSIRLLTKDHTFVQTLIDEGRITEEEARVHPHRNMILQSVEGAREAEPDLFWVELTPGDRLMFCSDGASGSLTDEEIRRILSPADPAAAAADLVRDAIEAGSTDNVTVIVADVLAAEDTNRPLAQPPQVVGAAAEKRRPLGTRRVRMRHKDTGELPAVPGLPPEAREVDPEEIRYAPRAPGRFRWVRRLLALVVIGVLGYFSLAAAYNWTQRQYFVAESHGYVAVYQGIPASIPGLNLHHVVDYTASPTLVTNLTPYCQNLLDSNIGEGDRAHATKTAITFPQRPQCRLPEPTIGTIPRRVGPTLVAASRLTKAEIRKAKRSAS